MDLQKQKPKVWMPDGRGWVKNVKGNILNNIISLYGDRLIEVIV